MIIAFVAHNGVITPAAGDGIVAAFAIKFLIFGRSNNPFVFARTFPRFRLNGLW